MRDEIEVNLFNIKPKKRNYSCLVRPQLGCGSQLCIGRGGVETTIGGRRL